MSRKIRVGMIGGGQGAFIGAIHRMAMVLDGQMELVCGAFSSNPEKSKLSGNDLYLNPSRVYNSYTEMIETEATLSSDVSMDVVVIVTPNHLHYDPAIKALENGFHVICDKPLCNSLEQAVKLEDLVNRTGLIFALTHNYTGYPMVKEAKEMIRHGEIGRIRKIVVSYPQGWLSTYLEGTDQKQATWRTDPKKSGIAGAMGDIGTHAANLAEYITNLKITAVCADLSIFVKNRMLDDDGSVLLRFENGAKGVLIASQICAGEENNLSINIYGEKGGIEWSHANPNSLYIKWLDRPMETRRTGGRGLYPMSEYNNRLPAGHPEGFIGAFANIYHNVARCIQARLDGKTPPTINQDFPTIYDGVRGVKFIESVVNNSKSDQKWTNF